MIGPLWGGLVEDKYGALKRDFWATEDEYLNRDPYVDEPWHCWMCDREWPNDDKGGEEFCDHMFDCRDEQLASIDQDLIDGLLQLQKEFKR